MNAPGSDGVAQLPDSGLDRLSEFYRATGRPAEVQSGRLWVAETRLSVMHVPGAAPISVRRGEVEGILGRTGRIAGLFSPAVGTGLEVSKFVVRDRDYGLQSLQRQFRQQVRKAQTHFEVRPMEWAQLGIKGVQANRDSQLRRGQGEGAVTDPVRWAGCCEVAARVPGLEVSGCLTPDGDLAAYLITWTCAGICHGLQLHWTDRHRELHPTHLLYFETIRRHLNRGGTDVFSVGRQTLPAMLSVDRFKDHAGFVREPCSVAVVLRPGLRWVLVNPLVLGMLRAGCRIRKGEGRWSHVQVLEAAAMTRVS